MGNEFRVNTYTDNWQSAPDVITLADGSFIVFWDSYFNEYDNSPDTYYIAAQRYDADGRPVGIEQVVDARAFAASRDVRGTALSDGGYALTWSFGDDGVLDDYVVMTQAFDADGTARFAARQVNSVAQLDEARFSEVAALKDGGFLVVYTGYDSGAVDFPDIYVRRYTANGQPQGPDLRLNTNARDNDQLHPEVAVLANGNVLVSWYSEGTAPNPAGDNPLHEIRGTLFRPDGTILRADFHLSLASGAVNDWAFGESTNDQAITGLAGGGFALTRFDVTLGDDPDPTLYNVWLQLYDASGNQISADIPVVQTTDGVPDNTHVTQLATGEIVVVWKVPSADTFDDFDDVRARIFSAEGTPLTAEFQLAQNLRDDQDLPRITALSGGGFFVTWQSEAIDPDHEGISGRIFGRGTGGDDVLGVDVTQGMAGLGGNDILTGNGKANRLDGQGGTEELSGGKGKDTLNGGLGADTLLGGAGVDRLSGGAKADHLTGGGGGDAFVFETLPSGAADVDRITDMAGADELWFDRSAFAGIAASGPLAPQAFKVLGSGTIDDDDRLLYDAATGTLYYDSNGAGSGGRLAVVALEGAPALTAADILVI